MKERGGLCSTQDIRLITVWLLGGDFVSFWEFYFRFDHSIFPTPLLFPLPFICEVKWKWKSLSGVPLFATPWTIHPWNSPGQNTGVGSLSLLQGIFPTQGLKQGLPHCSGILYQLSHKGSPKILGWVAYPFSSRSSWPRNRTGVSCIAGRFFTNWAIKEAFNLYEVSANSGDFHPVNVQNASKQWVLHKEINNPSNKRPWMFS